jgi:hypothetical protein
MERSDLSRVLLRVSAACLCVAALLGIVGVLSGSFDETTVRITITAVALGVYSAIAGATSGALAQESLRVLAALSALASAVALILALGLIWDEDAELWEAWGCFTIFAVSGTQACELLGDRRPGDSPLVERLLAATLVAIGLATSAAIAAILGQGDADDSFGRLLAVLIILDVGGTLLVPIMRRLQSPSRREPAPQVAHPAAAVSSRAAGRVVTVAPGGVALAAQEAEALGSTPLLGPTQLADGSAVAVLRRADGELVVLHAPAEG